MQSGRRSDFWDALAPYHSAIENNYLDVASVRRIVPDICGRVLIVGAGQGLIVAELRKHGFECDGIDLSAEMIKYARLRRGLALIQADATALPFRERAYETIIYATGVVDFIGDEEQIRRILNEGQRIVNHSGRVFVAFYRFSAALETYLKALGLLAGHMLAHKEILDLYLLTPKQTLAWVARRTGDCFRAATLILRMAVSSTMKEKTTSFRMQKIFREMDDPRSLINAAPEKQPYRNEAEIRHLFRRLGIAVLRLATTASCHIVQIK